MATNKNAEMEQLSTMKHLPWVRAAAAAGPNQASGRPAALRADAALSLARPRPPGGHGSAYGLFAKLAKMRRVNPFSKAMSADEKSRIARR